MGAFYCFPRVTDATGLDDGTFAEKLLERGARRRRARQRVRAVRRRARPRLLRDRVRGDRGGHGPHRALRRPPPQRDAARSSAASRASRSRRPTTRPPWHPRWRRSPPRSSVAPPCAPMRPSSTSAPARDRRAPRHRRGTSRRSASTQPPACSRSRHARRQASSSSRPTSPRFPLEDGSVDVVLAVHALLFAGDRVAALREWLRVTAPGGRLSRCRCPDRATSCPAPYSARSTTSTA